MLWWLFVVQVANIYNVEKLKICKKKFQKERILVQNLVCDRYLWTTQTEIISIYFTIVFSSRSKINIGVLKNYFAMANIFPTVSFLHLLYSIWISFFNSKFILTGLARRLVVCVSPNYLRLVDREHQTSGGDYHPQPSTRYHNCKIQMTTKTNTETETKTENIRSLEGITTLLTRQTQMILL